MPASIIEALLGLQLGSLEQDASNRFCFDGLALGPGPEGALAIAIRRFEATSLRLAAAPVTIDIGRFALHKIDGQVRNDAGKPRLSALQAASAELSGVKLQGSIGTAASQAAGAPWLLGPLGSAEGSVRAKIVDAHLLFDSDVTVPIHHGQIDFNQATVEHVGPDSRMGVSRLGVYVDAPNGRSYLYQFPSAPVGGVEFERRGALPGPWASERGKLQLQPFAEGLLRQGPIAHGPGFTEQARLLFDRTAVSGEVRLGDGKFAAPGMQAEMAGHAEGRNVVRIHSEAVGRGLTLEVPSLSLRALALNVAGAQMGCDELTGSLVLRLFAERAQLRFAFELANVKLTGVRVQGNAPR